MRLFALAATIVFAVPASAQQVAVEAVRFASRDGKTEVNGYVFKAANAPEHAPAVVMMHGRAGAYSARADGKYDAETLSARHKAWGRLLARSGYIALMVDDFGPVGYPGGFRAGTYKDRPAAVDEVTNRPLHAYGALRYLQQRPDVDGGRVALLGWSNGGSATLAAMADDKPGDMRKIGFQAGVSLYPGCGLKNRFEKQGYKPYAPVRVFMGGADEEVSPASCERLVAKSRAKGGDIDLTSFPGATHSYDTPTQSRQKVKANADAKAATEKSILAFLAGILKER
ncbi:MAG TPA: dienelactone hydrolase family protein [Sphingopyxis sp.]|uniref:dienelactone hydrolase family protein n=1 Tax=Sphingopyxis sp. TaxID=1908224 RepID=UPI002C516578|nr:dienelactone hydrolase family protein [Sphingopyxis sp.]HWW58870.1 dienelactone hydrolase family protein [Sphingopyxis sp.]